jgi:DNA modification methylase
MSRAPGSVRDPIISYLSNAVEASVSEIRAAVEARLGPVSPSSIRSYLNLNTPSVFERTARGAYKLKGTKFELAEEPGAYFHTYFELGRAKLFHADCFNWLAQAEPHSIHAVVTDPPYGMIEYTEKEQHKLRNGNKGGIWRIPPSFDGHKRSPLPRFTVLRDSDRHALRDFFLQFGTLVLRATVPGANVVVASNSLLAHIVAEAMANSGLELRGYITRLVMTMRGGDRPKNAHEEFPGISVMPRSMFEPWVVLRHPLEGRVQDNLRKWKTGGFRRPSSDRPFGDVIRSTPTPSVERRIAGHPSLKPQAFLRAVVRAVLPLGHGVVCDPFAGSGSTLAAANFLGYESVGIEKDPEYLKIALSAIDRLSRLPVDPV